jgi:hypothetical protein
MQPSDGRVEIWRPGGLQLVIGGGKRVSRDKECISPDESRNLACLTT